MYEYGIYSVKNINHEVQIQQEEILQKKVV